MPNLLPANIGGNMTDPYSAFAKAVEATKLSGQKADWTTAGHYIVGGVYAKEVHIPAEHMLVGHVHEYDHLSILAAGEVLLSEGGARPISIKAPAVIEIKAGVEHSVWAHVPSVWFCIHKIDPDLVAADPAAINAALIAPRA